MQVTGIIAEYNPFHNGHAYQLSRARALTGADYIVAVMSGNYVQRGAPALLEKHLRARMALEGGADLVLELPVRFSTASARDFASGAAGLLDALGVVTHLCFGSESGDTALLTQFAELLLEEPPAYSTALQEALRLGASYPLAHQRAMEAAWRERAPKDGPGARPGAAAGRTEELRAFFTGPNNILGMEYIRALRALHSPIRPLAIRRTSDNYHSGALAGRFASATAVRSALLGGAPERVAPYVPAPVYRTLMQASGFLPASGTCPGYAPGVSAPGTAPAHGAEPMPTIDGAPAAPPDPGRGPRAFSRESAFLCEDDFSLLLHARLLSLTAEELTGFLDFPPALANRTARLLGEFRSYSQFAGLLKTREITRTRIDRALLHALLNIKRDAAAPPFVRMLGFRRDAAPLLRAIKQNGTLPLAGKMASVPLSDWHTDLFCDNLYHAVLSHKTGRPFRDERSIPLVIL